MSKVKVRIAVAVDGTGAWNSCGWGPTTSNDDDMMGMAIDPLDSPEARYWIEAEIDLPSIPTIQGNATESDA